MKRKYIVFLAVLLSIVFCVAILYTGNLPQEEEAPTSLASEVFYEGYLQGCMNGATNVLSVVVNGKANGELSGEDMQFVMNGCNSSLSSAKDGGLYEEWIQSLGTEEIANIP